MPRSIIHTYHIIAKTKRPCTNLPMFFISFILKGVLNSIVCVLHFSSPYTRVCLIHEVALLSRFYGIRCQIFWFLRASDRHLKCVLLKFLRSTRFAVAFISNKKLLQSILAQMLKFLDHLISRGLKHHSNGSRLTRLKNDGKSLHAKLYSRQWYIETTMYLLWFSRFPSKNSQ